MSAAAAAKLAAGRKKLEEYKLKKNCIPDQSKNVHQNNGTAENDHRTFAEVANQHIVDGGDNKYPVVQNNGIQTTHPPSEDEESADERISTPEFLKLKQQLQIHSQTVEFLVSEKNALLSKNNELESTVANMRSHNEDLSGRLNISRHRASCLEMEHSKLREKMDEIAKNFAQSQLENSKYKTLESSFSSRCGELKEELQEAKLLINDKILENDRLKKRLEEMTFHINAGELRLQQLGQGYSQNTSDVALVEQNRDYQQQIAKLNHQLKELDAERNQSNLQYQQYVQQLNNQLESMSQKHETLLSENENLMNRESNLIQQMDSLEKQLQNTIHVLPDPKLNDKKEFAHSQNEMKNVEDENQKLKVLLDEREKSLQNAAAHIEFQNQQLSDLNNTLLVLQSDRPDVSKLNAAMESDKIAAQKATTQNAKLKIELESLQEAYKKMTDSKLELAELLQAEKNLSKTLTLTLADNDEKLKETHSKLVAKDEEMIRLQAESSELEKQSLKHAQIVDRLNHYEAQNQSTDVVQKELEFSRNLLKTKCEEIEKLKLILSQNQKSIQENNDISSDENPNLVNEISSMVIPNEIPQNDIQNETEVIEKLKNETCRHIPATEAMKKLQERFTKLMDDVADLSDDKQRLEHLVLQLQGETETIGEYIALYQKQRSVLKQREYEKDIQLNLLSQEKQQMKQQLDQLNSLIELLIKENETKSLLINQKEIDVKEENDNTAGKIINLLSEIKSSHLVNSSGSMVSDNFHPCPWCSGNLITV